MALSRMMPDVSPVFIEKLEKTFPQQIPSPISTIEEIMFDAGRQDLIRWIKTHATKDTIVLGTME